MEFIASTKELKKSLSIVSLATGKVSGTIQEHALFSIKDKKIHLYATDNDKMGTAYLPVISIKTDKDIEFTADPKKIQKVISCSDLDIVKFVYDENTKTLNIYASEDPEAYVTFASLEPEKFLAFNNEIENTKKIKSVDAITFLSGLKFIQGFLPDNDNNKKYANLYIIDGTMYGSNGIFKIGAFESPCLENINITIRRPMLQAISSFIDFIDSSEVFLSETEKIIALSSADMSYTFAFRKAVLTAPKFPIKTEIPDTDGFSINRDILFKKINRLSLTSADELGIKMTVNSEILNIETIADRISYEKMVCKRLVGNGPLEFTLECSKFKAILDLFLASEVSIYIDKSKCIIHSKADIVVEEEPEQTSVPRNFTAVGILTLAKLV